MNKFIIALFLVNCFVVYGQGSNGEETYYDRIDKELEQCEKTEKELNQCNEDIVTLENKITDLKEKNILIKKDINEREDLYTIIERLENDLGTCNRIKLEGSDYWKLKFDKCRLNQEKTIEQLQINESQCNEQIAYWRNQADSKPPSSYPVKSSGCADRVSKLESEISFWKSQVETKQSIDIGSEEKIKKLQQEIEQYKSDAKHWKQDYNYLDDDGKAFQISLQGGMNIGWIGSNDSIHQLRHYEPLIGGSIGLVLSQRIAASNLRVELSPYYSREGYQLNIIPKDTSFAEIYNVITVPIQLSYGFGGKVKCFLEAGVYGSYIFSGKRVLKDNKKGAFDLFEDNFFPESVGGDVKKTAVNRLNEGFLVSIRVGTKDLSVGVHYMHGLSNMNNRSKWDDASYKKNWQYKMRTLQVSCRVRLAKP